MTENQRSDLSIDLSERWFKKNRSIPFEKLGEREGRQQVM
jgi:hypothetical protein